MNRSLSPFWLLFILTGLNLFNYLDRSVGSAVLTAIKNEFVVEDLHLGWITTVFMIGYFVTSPLFGYLGDRTSRKWLIALGILVWSLGTVLTGTARTFAWLLFYRVLVGVGEASYATISPSLISDAFPPAKRNNALTIFYVAIPVGSALGYAIGGEVGQDYGWRNAFIWAGMPGLFLALVLLPFREPVRGQAEGVRVEKPNRGDVLKLFRLPDYNLVVWGYTAYTFAMGAFAVWGPTFLHRIHEVEEGWAAKFFGGVLVVTGLLGTFVGGLVATAWHKRHPAGYAWMLFLAVALATPAAAGAFLAPNRTFSMACLAAAMFFIFLATGPVNTLILETVPVNMRASAMAVSIFAIHLFGDMWSSAIVGWLSGKWGGLQNAVLILPAAMCVAAVFWFALAWKTQRGRNGSLV
jgi:predicted MFS family arabinose efflux permease